MAATRSLDQARVSCLVRNRLGQTSAEQLLSVKCEFCIHYSVISVKMKEQEKHQGTPVAINSVQLTHPQTVCYFLPLTLTEIQMMTEN